MLIYNSARRKILSPVFQCTLSNIYRRYVNKTIIFQSHLKAKNTPIPFAFFVYSYISWILSRLFVATPRFKGNTTSWIVHDLPFLDKMSWSALLTSKVYVFQEWNFSSTLLWPAIQQTHWQVYTAEFLSFVPETSNLFISENWDLVRHQNFTILVRTLLVRNLKKP